MNPTPLTGPEITALATAGKAYPIGGPWEPWCTAADMQCPVIPPGVNTVDSRAKAIDWASQILYELTGRIFPGRAKDYVNVYLPRNRMDICSPTHCYCGNTLQTVRMNYRYPIIDVYSVVDTLGVTIDPLIWDFVAPNTLIRTDDQVWPCCGIKALAAVGQPPSSLAVRAAAELACALERIDIDENPCIPRGINSMTTPAGTVNLQPIREALAKGAYTRMPFVAQLLNMFPRDKARYTDVWSIDLEDVTY